jgi:hypothetical protein
MLREADRGSARQAMTSRRCAEVDEVAAGIPYSCNTFPPGLVLGLGDDLSSGVAQEPQRDIHVIDVHPEAETIPIGCPQSTDAYARTSSAHRDVFGLTVCWKPVRLREAKRLVEGPSDGNILDADDREGSLAHAHHIQSGRLDFESPVTSSIGDARLSRQEDATTGSQESRVATLGFAELLIDCDEIVSFGRRSWGSRESGLTRRRAGRTGSPRRTGSRWSCRAAEVTPCPGSARMVEVGSSHRFLAAGEALRDR